MIAVLCEGRSSDLPFLVKVFEILLSCKKQSPDFDFPLGKLWTKLLLPAGHVLGISAAGSYEKVLEAVPATASAAVSHGFKAVAVVVDLDDASLTQREQAVRDRISRSKTPDIPLIVVGVGVENPLVDVAREKNLDQVLAEIVLTARPAFRPILEAALREIRGLGERPTWKLATCILAGALGREDSAEAVYHAVVSQFPAEASDVLSRCGVLASLNRLLSL